ncbi:MAG: hypothetical protein AB7T14_08250 [Candidatus Methylacidiphilaceae bacterium]
MSGSGAKNFRMGRLGAFALLLLVLVSARATAGQVRSIDVWGHKIAAGMKLRRVKAELGRPIASVQTEGVVVNAYGISEVTGRPVPLPSRDGKQLRTWVLIFDRKTEQLVGSMALVDDVREMKAR